MNANKLIDNEIARIRRKRATGTAGAGDALTLAKDTETTFAEIVAAEGRESAYTQKTADSIASAMLDATIDQINRSRDNLRSVMRDARRVVDCIDKLPVSETFRRDRYNAQRDKIASLANRYNDTASAITVEYEPTINDDQYFARCKTLDDFTRYILRLPHGNHVDEARKRIAEIKLRNEKRAATKRAVLSVLTALVIGAAIFTACSALGMGLFESIGCILSALALWFVYATMKTFAADSDKNPRRRTAYTLAAVATSLAGWMCISMESTMRQRHQLDEIIESPTEDAYTGYLTDRSNTRYADEALALYMQFMDTIFFNDELMNKPTQYPPLARMMMLGNNQLLPENMRQAIQQRVKLRTDSLYRIALAANDIDAWERFQSLAPSELYFDSSARIDSIEASNWSNESTAWQSAQRQGTKEAYERYLEFFPTGAHAQAATAHLVDFEVKDYRNQGFGIGESIERIADNDGPGSKIFINNASPYNMKLLVSGPKSVRMQVAPGADSEASLPDGTYKVLVEVDNQAHDKFSFVQKLENGIYSSSIQLK